MPIHADISAVIAKERESLIRFTSELVATPSLSGEEGAVAALVQAEMKRLQYDDVWVDKVGNVIGKIHGGSSAAILLNGHMDVVDPGPPDGWPHPAYNGAVVDGELWGRGSVDMKGPVAAMIYGAAAFKQIEEQPPGDVYMTVAVMEEIGGLGSQYLVEKFREDGIEIAAAIVGEPSNSELRLGHRGRIELQIKFHGRSAHASVPHLGENPHFAAARFLAALDQITHLEDPVLGKSTIAPTLYLTDQVSANVIPSEVTLYLDWRNVPQETPEHAVNELSRLLESCLGSDSSSSPTVEVTLQERLTWTGESRSFASVFPSFSTAPGSELAKSAAEIINSTTGKPSNADVWKFATDGGHIASAGIPVIGYGPGDDALAHTNQERISVEELTQAAATYGSLVASWVR